MKSRDDDTGAPWVRLSDACARLTAVGIGTADLIAAIGLAGMAGHGVATGFQSVIVDDRLTNGVDRVRVRRMFWRVLCSPKAEDAGFVRIIVGERVTWYRDEDGHAQESYDALLFDGPTFALFVADVKARSAGNTQQLHEVAGWIRSHGGRNGKAAWRAYKTELGRRAVTQLSFEDIWRHERDNPRRGAPKKS